MRLGQPNVAPPELAKFVRAVVDVGVAVEMMGPRGPVPFRERARQVASSIMGAWPAHFERLWTPVPDQAAVDAYEATYFTHQELSRLAQDVREPSAVRAAIEQRLALQGQRLVDIEVHGCEGSMRNIYTRSVYQTNALSFIVKHEPI